MKEGTGTLTLTGANTYTGDTLVNAGVLDNRGSINRATVNNNATLGNWANAGYFSSTTASIDSVDVYSNGQLENRASSGVGAWGTARATINIVNVYDNGYVDNRANAGLGLLGDAIASINTLNVYNNGRVDNRLDGTSGTATIGTVNIYDAGTVWNHSNATIANAMMDSGQLGNYGTITNATQYGGAITNSSQIVNMEYFGGDFYGQGGTIGTLTVASDLDTTANWGNIGHLQFSENGLGTLVFAGSVSETMDTALASTLSFGGLLVQSIDFAFGNILLDLTGFGTLGSDLDFLVSSVFGGDGLFLGSLFGSAEVDWDVTALASFQIGWEDERYWVYTGDDFAKDWKYSEGFVSWTGTRLTSGDEDDDNPAPVPEPGTLLILGLGLMGAGLAARRRRK